MTLVKVLLVWSMCSDVTEFGAWGLPQAAASPPPSGRARAGRTVFSSRLAMGSSKAEAVERKGDKRTGEWRGGRKREGRGLRQRVSGAVSHRTSDTPNQAPNTSCARLPCQLSQVGPTCATERHLRPSGGQQSGLGIGVVLSPQTLLGSWSMETSRGAGWGRDPLLWMEVAAPARLGGGEWVKFWAWASLGSIQTWYVHGSPWPEVAWGLGKSSGFPGVGLGGCEVSIAPHCPLQHRPVKTRPAWPLSFDTGPATPEPQRKVREGGCVFGAKERGSGSGRGLRELPLSQGSGPRAGTVPGSLALPW